MFLRQRPAAVKWKAQRGEAEAGIIRRVSEPVARASTIPSARWALSDIGQLLRPRLMKLGLVVTALSYAIARPEPFDAVLLAWTLGGAGLALGAASALNQVLERDVDARMRRTADRPLPAGRMTVGQALGLALGMTGLGLAMLALRAPLAAVCAAAGMIVYVGVYTPLKRVDGIATVVGAVPGAVPVLIGWAAATDGLSAGAWRLFLVLFLWQLPHFLAIGWMYRADYRRAGLRMMPDGDGDEAATVRQVVAWSVALVVASLLPTVAGDAGAAYAVVALLLGAAFLGVALQLARRRTPLAARALLKASVVYLPLLLAALAVDVLVR